MNTETYQRVELAREPHGAPVEDDFRISELPMPDPGPGEVLCATEHLSLDPYMRSQIAGRHISGSIGIGDPMLGETVSRVLISNDPAFEPGDLVRCFGGWRTHSLHPGKELQRLPDDFPQSSLALSTLGMPGLTAWAGIHCLAKVNAGETVLIPAATGAVGSVASQLAKAAGCRVIGIAGTEDKCRLATNELGYDHCINRRTQDLPTELDKHCPDGIDVYFDLIGGKLLTQASERLAIGGRVLLCGLMADYNGESRTLGPPPGLWIRARAIAYGLVVYDFEHRRDEFLELASSLHREGRLISNEHVSHGLASAPSAFCQLMRGENTGKALVSME